jgi:Ca2+/Na+ antiporter
MLILFFANLYDFPVFGMSVLIGFAITTITLIMGIFLFFNEVPIVYEGHRNATFMWSAALLLFIVSMDRFIDRMDAIFLLVLFAFYTLYIWYRTGKSKDYVFLKRRAAHMILYPVSIFAIIASCFLVMSASVNVERILNLPDALLGLLIIGPVLSLPMLDVIKNVFGSATLTFDNIMGNVIAAVTLMPGIIALITPIPLSIGDSFNIVPLIMLNAVCLSFAMITRMERSVHKKTGMVLILIFIAYLAYSLLF